MSRTVPALFAALPVAALVAWRLGGALGTGVLAGFLLGCAVGGLAHAWQVHTMRHNPENAFGAFGLGFLAKVLGLGLGAAAFNAIEPLALRVDWRTYLLAFIGAVLVLMVAGTFDHLRFLKECSARRQAL
ncbi:MAG: hypothetical protein QF724_09640 [Planctomycetota bacterium]|jgi:ABC-type lipoprotein release transport system permease subunit|nr:hypothetical protein [Planctomycetota bacterium]MDP6520352.1 hypothetical protein [Planctomycetota bacterium]MDP6839186.1 hypothetical protein [Planctomycetota bacterium]MDP6955487.1 hypothetical protein [Planctomycetota bacterium]